MSYESAQLAFGRPLKSKMSRLGHIFKGAAATRRASNPYHRKKSKHHKKGAPTRHHRGFVVPNELMKMMLYKALFREMRD
jgi:hypothetical protein